MYSKNKLAMLVAEFIGSGILTLVVMGVQHSTIGVPYFVGIGAALAAAMLITVFGMVSGAVLNPAVTIALWTARRMRTVPAALFIVVQLLGAWAAYYVFSFHTQSDLNVVNSDLSMRVAVAEAVGALVLGFGWAAAVYGRFTVGQKAVAVGLGYFLGMVIASAAAIGLVNPAFALADRAWTIWGSLGWFNYVLGPVVGAVVGVNLYGWLFNGQSVVARASSARVTSASSSSAASSTTAKRSTTSRGKKTATKRKASTRRK